MFKIFSSLALALLLSTPALAQNNNMSDMGSNAASQAKEVKISNLNDLNDEVLVSTVGRISPQTGSDDFSFTDGTGTVMLHMDQDLWNNLNLSPNDEVIVYGEVDKNFLGGTAIEVVRLVKMNPSSGNLSMGRSSKIPAQTTPVSADHGSR